MRMGRLGVDYQASRVRATARKTEGRATVEGEMKEDPEVG